ncbi:heavy-metal-associated domain-containing protein [Erythrobacter sp.]|uniref:heavy-metal-associated domain-containing protein n=1 Tax=Erythrobacter sp. TaxID=1042 RepID=UPI0025BA842D|nr:heavy-metal-associated domain-containing protein [Erythrobacter sp.]
MTASSSPLRPPLAGTPLPPRRWLRHGAAALGALALLSGGYALVLAQVSGERGIAPTASSVDIEVSGIAVDVTADSAEEAREQAWREAQRRAWEKVDGPAISDSQLSGLVSAIVIERENIGPKRYIATLGVVFDRQRAGRYLGGQAQQRSSAPMLLIPVIASGGAYTTFERRNEWQRAWAEFNPGTSRIDYVRPSGAGGDSLLINFGQTRRRSRAWWRTTLDQYGAADALVPIARVDYQFPGGPARGIFTARYGPDSTFLGEFELSASSPEEVPDMLAEAVRRFDRIFEAALEEGKLTPDPTLRESDSGDIDPALLRLIELGRAIQQREAEAGAEGEGAGDLPAPGETGPAEAQETPSPAETSAPVRAITVQFASPDAGAFDATLSAMRGVPGVRSLAVTSTAMGGTSVMSVRYAGSLDDLAEALVERGFAVNRGAGALAISR